MSDQRAPEFRGRSSERATLDRLLADVRRGQSGVLVIRGEAGVGKTALLRYVAQQASGFRVAQVAGVESEMELAYAGLHQLCASMLAHLDVLPQPQQLALNVALGLCAGDPPDRFLVALATLGVMSATAEEQPLLCVVDDLQWLDDASLERSDLSRAAFWRSRWRSCSRYGSRAVSTNSWACRNCRCAGSTT